MGLAQKKIIIVFNDLNIGGIETKIVDICRFYSKKTKVKVYLLLRSKNGILLKNLPKNIVIISPSLKLLSKINTVIFPFWLAEQFKSIRPNLIISFGNYSSISSVLGNFFDKNNSKIIISDDSGLQKQVKKETFPKIRTILMKAAYPRANKIILLTNKGKNELIKLIPKTKNKIVVRKNWLPLNFGKKSDDVKKEIDVLFLGRFEKQKNPIKFLKIVEKFKDKFNVVMVGYGSLKDQIISFIKRKGLVVETREATIDPAFYYQKSKIMILTSDYEGFPLTILESFSCGCVPLCNRIPEIEDFFEKYADDVLFNRISEANKKAIFLLENDKKREEICMYYKNKILSEQKINFKNTINEFEI